MSKTHKDVVLTPTGRLTMVESAMAEENTLVDVAIWFNVTPQTVRKWVNRYKKEGEAGLQDRSSRPDNSLNETPADKKKKIIELRKTGLCGSHIACKLDMPLRTVCAIIERAGLSRAKDISPPEDSPQRYEYNEPGDMIHLDIKKLRNFNEEGIMDSTNGSRSKSANKGAYSQCMHVAVDDHSRYASVSIFDDETADSVTQHLIDTYNFYASQGIVIKRVLTDNCSGYKSKKFADACDTLNLKHIFTQPYTPQTNGKVERFIQTLLREWAYVRTYKSSEQRNMFLEPFLHMYNWHRPHSGIDGKSPIRRLYKGNYNLPAYHKVV